jgi:hypothetical protein
MTVPALESTAIVPEPDVNVDTSSLSATAPPVEATATSPPPEAFNAPPIVTAPLWFIVMPPAPVAVTVPAVTLVKVVPVDENAGAVADVTVTAPFIATGPLLVILTLSARMIFDTVTPAFAELTVTEASAVPLPTAPAKLTLPVPAAMPRLYAVVFDTVLAKETLPAPDSMVRFAPRLTGPVYVCKPVVSIVATLIFIAAPVTCRESSGVVPPMAPPKVTVPVPAFTVKAEAPLKVLFKVRSAPVPPVKEIVTAAAPRVTGLLSKTLVVAVILWESVIVPEEAAGLSTTTAVMLALVAQEPPDLLIFRI